MINSIKDHLEGAGSIKNCIVSTLRKQGLNVNGLVVYNGKSLEIADNNWTVHMWLRLIWDCELDKCIVQLSNVSFAESIQRRGYFTSVVASLKKNKYVDNIVIQSVISEEMENWCKKHRFHSLSGCGFERDYIWKA